MDYEKKYKEALERAKEFYILCKKCGAKDTVDFLEDNFPELCEPDDEKIRKTLIRFFKDNYPNETEMYDGTVTVGKALAWLEKQGEYKSPEEVLKIRQELYQSGYNDGYKHGCEDSKKQSEQKPIDKIQLGKKYKCIASPRYSTFRRGKIYKPVDNFLCSLMNLCYECFEPIEDSKQKLANKTEPKFKVGDWVVTSYGKVNQVIAVDEDGDGFTLDDDTYFSGSWKDSYHLWTIQDAKEGDILQSNNKPFIYNEYLEEGKYPFGYGGINLYGRFGVSNGLLPMTHDEVTPATKEQCDTLFAKMKEAGYEWDAERKELKKINKNTDVGHEYFSDLLEKDDCDNIDDYAYQCAYCMSHDWMKDTATWDDVERACKLGAEWNERHHNSSWSEEDAVNFNLVYTYVPDDSLRDWLKSLKDRLQPKQEWSKGDMEMLNAAISFVEHSSFTTIGKGKNNTVAWLKSLKPQNHWKPSDEQMKALHDLNLTGNISYAGQGQVLIELYNDLKKLAG